MRILYYLSFGYYDPVIGRFISPNTTAVLTASPTALTDKNLYAYCDNNPVMRVDEDGEFWLTAFFVGAAIGAGVQYLSDVVSNLLGGKSLEESLTNIHSSAIDYVSAAISGGLAATGISTATSIIANAGLGALSYLFNSASNGNDISTEGFMLSTFVGGLAGRIGGSGANAQRMRGIINNSTQILKTAISPKKIALYSSKITNSYKSLNKSVLRTISASMFSYTTNRLWQ